MESEQWLLARMQNFSRVNIKWLSLLHRCPQHPGGPDGSQGRGTVWSISGLTRAGGQQHHRSRLSLFSHGGIRGRPGGGGSQCECTNQATLSVQVRLMLLCLSNSTNIAAFFFVFWFCRFLKTVTNCTQLIHNFQILKLVFKYPIDYVSLTPFL